MKNESFFRVWDLSLVSFSNKNYSTDLQIRPIKSFILKDPNEIYDNSMTVNFNRNKKKSVTNLKVYDDFPAIYFNRYFVVFFLIKVGNAWYLP